MVNNIEIEIKVPITREEFNNIEEFVKNNAEFVKQSNQQDEYFTPPHRNFVEPRYPYEWLRIGQRGGKTILNYKHFYPENAFETTHCDEFETEVKDSEQLLKIFASLGIKSLVKVEKKRTAYNYKNTFEIALDEVRELGYFVEVEVIKEFVSIDEANYALREFVQNLGIDVSKKDNRGYPYLMMQKKGLLK